VGTPRPAAPISRTRGRVTAIAQHRGRPPLDCTEERFHKIVESIFLASRHPERAPSAGKVPIFAPTRSVESINRNETSRPEGVTVDRNARGFIRRAAAAHQIIVVGRAAAGVPFNQNSSAALRGADPSSPAAEHGVSAAQQALGRDQSSSRIRQDLARCGVVGAASRARQRRGLADDRSGG
jgi:hypothetical protein